MILLFNFIPQSVYLVIKIIKKRGAVETLCGPSQDPLSSSHRSQVTQVPLSVATETSVIVCYLLAHAESELLTLLL